MPAGLVKALDLAVARRAGSVLPGERPAPGVGDGTELAQLRPYQPGDDVRRLDPAATPAPASRTCGTRSPSGRSPTWLVLDVSASMAFGTADRLKCDVAEGVALLTARLATRRGGRVALATCGAERERRLRPRGGRSALAAVRRVLAEGVATRRPGG